MRRDALVRFEFNDLNQVDLNPSLPFAPARQIRLRESAWPCFHFRCGLHLSSSLSLSPSLSLSIYSLYPSVLFLLFDPAFRIASNSIPISLSTLPLYPTLLPFVCLLAGRRSLRARCPFPVASIRISRWGIAQRSAST